MVYISAHSGPALIPRYLSTKREAEEYLQSLENLTATSLRPGFIWHANERPYSVFLKEVFDFKRKNIGPYMSYVPENPVKDMLKPFEPPLTVNLTTVVNSSIYCAFNTKFDNKIVSNDEIEKISKIFDEDYFQIKKKNFIKTRQEKNKVDEPQDSLKKSKSSQKSNSSYKDYLEPEKVVIFSKSTCHFSTYVKSIFSEKMKLEKGYVAYESDLGELDAKTIKS